MPFQSWNALCSRSTERNTGTLPVRIGFKAPLSLLFHWNSLMERGAFMTPFRSNYLLSMEHWNSIVLFGVAD